ncbi:MAG: 23S rRNA (uracil(1939)-C(5))-methyltransferase RlmD [Lactimicrobium sp.]|jgi:23S rRNA (uracil1939-C5)-methyltransferase|uniref:23S rRNA (uracil(1939)-C(5))-methyltransferase RlmD n=1 Tax=Lactimicrobium sp. TaxID=2563780 RepID=UPI002F360046
MKKNDTFTAVCSGYNGDGAGVVRNDDFVFFVPGLLRGEEAEIGITALKKTYGFGRIVRLIKPSSHRVKPICDVYKRCGGCQLMHMDHEEQCYFKEEKVKMCFRQNAGIEIEPEHIMTAEPYFNYRNKVQIPVQVNHGTIEMGFYQPHTNTIIPFTTCYAESELSNQIVNTLHTLFAKYHCASAMRHVLIKHAHVTGEVMVVFIVREYPFEGKEELCQELLKQYPQIKSLSVIVNKRTDNVILDGKEILLAGNPWIEEELLGCRFRISARSFYQINPYTTPLLYQTAIDSAKLTKNDVLVDLYCGTGTMGIIAAKYCKKVYGIEIVPDAIKDARKNAEINNVENIEFVNADAGQGAQRIIRSKLKVDAMIVDPPRKGCSKDTLDAMVKIAPKRLVYVSCDPATLARDTAYLTKCGYELKSIKPFDMFPNTNHVETVVLMSRRRD